MDIYRKKPPLFYFGIEDLTPVGAAANAIGGLVSGFSSIGAGKRQRKAIRLQHDLNMQAYERQLADQRQLIDEEREYNDFSSVVARAREAGINPQAVIGSANGGNISTSTPNLDTPQVDTLPSPLTAAGSALSSIGSAFNQSLLLKEQIRSQRLDNELKEKDLGNKGLEIENANQLAELQKEFHGYQNTIASVDAYFASNRKAAYDSMDENNEDAPGTAAQDEVIGDYKLRSSQRSADHQIVALSVSIVQNELQNLKEQGKILRSQASISRKEDSMYFENLYNNYTLMESQLALNDATIEKFIHDIEHDNKELAHQIKLDWAQYQTAKKQYEKTRDDDNFFGYLDSASKFFGTIVGTGGAVYIGWMASNARTLMKKGSNYVKGVTLPLVTDSYLYNQSTSLPTSYPGGGSA